MSANSGSGNNLPAGMQQIVVQGHTFTIDLRYSLTSAKILSRGSFGVVTTAVDTVTGETVAIKRIRPYANDEWDARHTLREIRLLKLLGDHPNVCPNTLWIILSNFLYLPLIR